MIQPTSTLTPLRQATQRLVRTVDALADDDWAAPSLLPGWTRGHVIAHLTLNADALHGVLRGVAEGHTVTMYRMPEARDNDIDELAATMSPGELRERLFAAVGSLARAVETFPDELADRTVHRTPGSAMVFPCEAVPWMRHREVEIHHADLGAGYGPADWPAEFVIGLIEHRVRLWTSLGEVDSVLHATDLGRSWTVGVGGPTVAAPGHVLAWWSTGRAPYPGLDAPRRDDGVLPGIEGM